MGLFNKKGKVIDWSEGYRASKKMQGASEKRDSSSNSGSDMEFLGSFANSDTSNSTDNVSWDNDSSSSSSQTVGEFQEKKTKLSRRLLDLTNRLEDLSNQIYHLKQRVELLEKKMKVSYS